VWEADRSRPWAVAATKSAMPRFPALDGWRAISILLVLAAHLFPLGPKSLNVNESVAALGMAMFFTLSGFLITTTLLYRPSVTEFLIRRLCRIVPLAWVLTVTALWMVKAPESDYVAQLLFYSNVPPFWLTTHTSHLWSLCVEMQFYMGIAAVFGVFGRRGLWAIPVVCLAVTAHRIQQHELISIVTSVRMDEILSGATLALICATPRLEAVRIFIAWVNPFALLVLAFFAANTLCGPLDYLRPYLVSCMVGSTLFKDRRATEFLKTRTLAYIAEISYALYILHPIIRWGWFVEGSKWIIYAKRIPALMGVFGLAHLSTFYFEAFWIRKGKEWGNARPLIPSFLNSR
jgi:peptidoglycan/LPS O-acetylase OafA/YrhL